MKNNVPVLLITFNRPTHTSQVFNVLKKNKISKLYVFQDGARDAYSEDKSKIFEVRNVFSKGIDWSCDLKTYYSDKNLGCGYGPVSAISWFFEHEEYGIILEDDCLPSDSFFPFCAELLQKYKDDKKVGIISGFNPVNRWRSNVNSYSFSLLGGNWGWASWRDRWEKFDYSAKDWQTMEAKASIKIFVDNNMYFNHFSKEFDAYLLKERADVWDFQWFFARLYNNYYSIVPSVNQIQNIGFGVESTHTSNTNDRVTRIMKEELSFPLKHPAVKLNKVFDWVMFNRFWIGRKSLLRKIILKLIEKVYCA